jgi:ABC-type antimicrobial peptide transport system permease subunit
MLNDLCRAGVEAMTDMSSGSNRRELYKDVIASVLSLVVAVLIVAFVGKWLWNTTVAELFTFARPVRSVWQIIGLMILISLLR